MIAPAREGARPCGEFITVLLLGAGSVQCIPGSSHGPVSVCSAVVNGVCLVSAEAASVTSVLPSTVYPLPSAVSLPCQGRPAATLAIVL